MDQKQVINIVRRYKNAVAAKYAGAKVYLYGSYSKGTARLDSDIDVAVVIPECKADWLDTSATLWDISTTINSLIEPVLLEKKHPTPLYDDVMRTGIAI